MNSSELPNIELALWSQEVEDDLRRLDTLLRSGIFNRQNHKNILGQSAFIETMILLNDLLAKARKKNLRINFTDAVVVSPQIADVTDLVAVIRNAACHIPSNIHHVDESGNRFTYNIMEGKHIDVVRINDVILGSEYEDDTAFFYGRHRIYLKRHIVKAVEEARNKLEPLTC